ncbi:hypothetical protein [Pseudomonas phage PPpW-3]|uniref:Uncharacterized protein n=1 Tax=Pseudomonas phage PPpW-3 TaxID=1279082 RepID=V5YSV5_9CAUD|nr:hypothetical protein X916_gp45 [Pseudomonas phage PPpW-3]BAO20645.1 hypothetical protein [Pseudomonas phage PPpW-3]
MTIKAAIEALESLAHDARYPGEEKVVREELERIKRIADNYCALNMDAQQELMKLRGQMDEQVAILRLARQFVVNGVDLGYITMPDPETPDPAHDLVPKIDAALSVSAEPSAPVEIDERAAFEEWYIRDVGPGLANLSRANAGSRTYIDEDAMSAWEGWQARAALERKQ